MKAEQTKGPTEKNTTKKTERESQKDRKSLVAYVINSLKKIG